MAKKETTENIDLATVQAEIAKMLADAKAEAEKIVAEAKAATGKPGMTSDELKEHKAYMDELVEIKLFKDSGKYKDDVVVGVNGEFIAIKRGERVKIKRKFAEVLDHQERQDMETAEMIEKKSGEWDRMAKEAHL